MCAGNKKCKTCSQKRRKRVSTKSMTVSGLKFNSKMKANSVINPILGGVIGAVAVNYLPIIKNQNALVKSLAIAGLGVAAPMLLGRKYSSYAAGMMVFGATSAAYSLVGQVAGNSVAGLVSNYSGSTTIPGVGMVRSNGVNFIQN